MNMELSRRQFMQGASAGVAGTTLGAFGFGDVEAAYAAAIRPFKLVGTTETRNTCPYCSVACGIIMYSKGDLHEGRAGRDHPHRGRRRPPDQSRHALPERRGAARFRARRRRGCTHADDPQAGLRQVRGRIAGTTRSTGSRALMKDDRDQNFVAKNDDGVTVNRWTDHRLPRRLGDHQRDGVR